MRPSLLESGTLIGLANIVAKNNVRYFVQVNANGSVEGLEVAARLNLQAHVHDAVHAAGLSRAFPTADVYDGDDVSFVKSVLPMIDASAIFILDGHSQWANQVEELIREADTGHTWFLMDPYAITESPDADTPGQNYSLGN